MKERLTKRAGNKVYINADAIQRKDCIGEFGFHYCQYSTECPSVISRKCPILRVLDRLAEYEDKEEIMKFLDKAKEKGCGE